jgi:hypothetical protein
MAPIYASEGDVATTAAVDGSRIPSRKRGIASKFAAQPVLYRLEGHPRDMSGRLFRPAQGNETVLAGRETIFRI